MSLRRRKKAIGKVVKLLNLATSTNSSESSMAFRHAESIILQHGLNQGDIPMYQLCDRTTLFKVSWSGPPRHAKAPKTNQDSSSVSQRRFSEKPIDPDKAYANAKTILDDGYEFEQDESVSEEVLGETEQVAPSFDDFDVEMSASKSATVNDDHVTMTEEPEEVSINTGEFEEMNDAVESDAVSDQDDKSEERFATHDNVIDASSAFRPSGESFKETLRNQYSSSNPDVPFEDDSYWSKVHEKLLDFDESAIQAQIDGLESQLTLAQEALKSRRSQRASIEQEEQRERSERARIEQSFEEAIERAFQARARAYEAWEAQRSELRIRSLRAEQDAQQGFEELSAQLVSHKEQYAYHIQLKEDYRAAKIMHELRHHLALAAKGHDHSKDSYAKVIAIMSESELSLRDLEFSDIRNKSLFIRLLERESALISDVHERETYTEEMLDKFLMMSRNSVEPTPSENPVERVQRMLKSIEGVSHFESQKVIEQVLRLMASHQISVRDLDYGCINKYSVFVCLINWEAEQIPSLSEREHFTSSTLEEYVQYSVRNPRSSQKA
ncbi:hypothetical protein DN730_16730 [Marinomonas piezotolerans]|uniref:DUF2786 domain-containing protein n=1 Tax=Marinomonas piezotolerans TaxID=2213058 RepID=A0A370U5C8_9GAMM|nr:DUF2786 domain-containing protein [Marinomonas piezotolerans]RDL42975.1 hypothetical protein DN730_16730 [Marinomonas piezotolerans]